ncbi:MAG: penicillin-binding protein 2 [Desulfovibrionaceae bacterium]|nr:penicillin-binding protein 2 [Desulfovibrionaceae bacterium]
MSDSKHFDQESPQPPKNGLILLQCLIFGLFCVFALRLWYLQVHLGKEFAEKARENQLRQELVYAPRGLIRDREGRLLAVNEPAYALGLVREDCKDVDATLAQVAAWTHIDLDELKRRFARGRKRVKPFNPLILVPDISYDLLAVIETNALFWPGLEIVIRPKRHYPQGAVLSHVLGFVAEANEEELERDPGLYLGDAVGKQGLEFVLEKRLRGKKGLDQYEVDATGRFLAHKVVRAPEAGANIDLSIDLDLQEFAARELEGRSGAVVVLDPDNGQVLALVSNPGYDNNAFVLGLSPEQWQALRDNPRHPLQNRAIQSMYPPGSVWKLLVGACGLSEGVIIPRNTVYCPGTYRLGQRVFRCWKKHGHGNVDFKRSLVESCDVYYYHYGERLGVDRISRYAFDSGFGKLTGIDLPHEKKGLVPTREWKRERFGEPWQGGENLNLAIGQGYTLVTPLQVARFVGALVNGGTLYRPNLLLDAPADAQAELPLSEAHRELIVEAMVATVDDPHGTARRLHRKDARMGGKTGTAQVVKIQGEDRLDTYEMPYSHRDHAWLASFGEKDGRRYVVVVMVEHGGHGGSAGGPMARAIYNHLFGKE